MLEYFEHNGVLKKVVVVNGPTSESLVTAIPVNKILLLKNFQYTGPNEKYKHLHGKDILAMVGNGTPLLIPLDTSGQFAELLFSLQENIKNKLYPK